MILKLKNRLQQSPLTTIFLLGFAFRLAFSFLTNILPKHVDGQRYDILSDQILRGSSYDLDAGTFICAPIFPYSLAVIKLIFGSHFLTALIVLQCLISALAGLAIYKLSFNLFKSDKTAWLTGLFCAVFPLAFWFVRSLGQESLYQSFLIFFVHYFVLFQKNNERKSLLIAAFFFGLSFLTKSYSLLWSPFLAISMLLLPKIEWQNRVKNVALFASISLLMTLPFGLLNWQKHGIYTLSSTGFWFFYWVNNSELTYERDYKAAQLNPINPDSIRTDTALYIFEITPPLSFISADEFLRRLPELPTIQEREALYRRRAKSWIEANPDKFWELRKYYLERFLMPGINPNFHRGANYWLMLLMSFPIYLAAYWSIFKFAKADFSRHSWMIFLFLTMLLFAVFFSMQHRFRSAMIDVFYILYAVPMWISLWENLRKRVGKV